MLIPIEMRRAAAASDGARARSCSSRSRSEAPVIEVPQAMTHQSVEGSAAAVPADLVRLSCGVEAAEDLVADLEQALKG